MSYQSMADAVLSTLRAKTPASVWVKTTNSSAKSDYRVMSNPTNGLALVITPSSMSREIVSFKGEREYIWGMDVEIFARYTGEIAAHELVVDASQDILDTLEAWEQLVATSGVRRVDVISMSEIDPLYGADGSGPHYHMRSIQVQVIESVTISEQE